MRGLSIDSSEVSVLVTGVPNEGASSSDAATDMVNQFTQSINNNVFSQSLLYNIKSMNATALTTSSADVQSSSVISSNAIFLQTALPSSQPTSSPSSFPSGLPSGQPTRIPSSQPTGQPTHSPSGQPSRKPSGQPSGRPSSQPSDQPSSQPTISPTSAPSCGAGYVKTTCEPCPVGEYAAIPGQKECILCPPKFFTDRNASTHCELCPWPHSSDRFGAHECIAFHLNLTFTNLAIVLSSVLGLYLFCWFAAGGESIAVTVNMMMPMLDHISDINYILTEEFHTVYFFAFAVLFLLAPSFMFFYELYDKAYYPRIWIPYTILWLDKDDEGRPRHKNKDRLKIPIINIPLTSAEQNDLTKLIWYLILWIILIAFQVVTIVLTPVWIVLDIIFLIIWLIIGTFLYQSRNMAIGRIGKMWYSNWNHVRFLEILEDEFRNNQLDRVDKGLMNRALFAGFVLETLPQLVLQVVNNMSRQGLKWTFGSIASTSMSVYMSMCGIYRFCYYKWYKGKSFEEIPIAVIEIPGIDAKYTAIGNAAEIELSRHKVKGDTQSIEKLSTRKPPKVISPSMDVKATAGITINFVEDPHATLLTVIKSQIDLLNNEKSYDHERIKKSKDIMKRATGIADTKKKRVKAVLNYFEIKDAVDLVNLKPEAKLLLPGLLTFSAYEKCTANIAYLQHHLCDAPVIMHTILNDRTNYLPNPENMLSMLFQSENYIKDLHKLEIDKLLDQFHARSVNDIQSGKCDSASFEQLILELKEGKRKLLRVYYEGLSNYKIDEWLFENGIHDEVNLRYGISYDKAIALSDMLPVMARNDFMFLWELVDKFEINEQLRADANDHEIESNIPRSSVKPAHTANMSVTSPYPINSSSLSSPSVNNKQTASVKSTSPVPIHSIIVPIDGTLDKLVSVLNNSDSYKGIHVIGVCNGKETLLMDLRKEIKFQSALDVCLLTDAEIAKIVHLLRPTPRMEFVSGCMFIATHKEHYIKSHRIPYAGLLFHMLKDSNNYVHVYQDQVDKTLIANKLYSEVDICRDEFDEKCFLEVIKLVDARKQIEMKKYWNAIKGPTLLKDMDLADLYPNNASELEMTRMNSNEIQSKL